MLGVLSLFSEKPDGYFNISKGCEEIHSIRPTALLADEIIHVRYKQVVTDIKDNITVNDSILCMYTCKLDHAILPIQRDAFLHASCAPKASSGAVCSYVPVPRIDLHTTSSRDDLYIVCNLNEISQATALFSLSFMPI